jgi:hypothetical protein
LACLSKVFVAPLRMRTTSGGIWVSFLIVEPSLKLVWHGEFPEPADLSGYEHAASVCIMAKARSFLKKLLRCWIDLGTQVLVEGAAEQFDLPSAWSEHVFGWLAAVDRALG